MESEAPDEAVEGVCSTLGEIRAEAVAADIFHLVFVWERGMAWAGNCLQRVLYRKTKSVKRRRTLKSDFWKDAKSLYSMFSTAIPVSLIEGQLL